jgi:hypothetical protein
MSDTFGSNPEGWCETEKSCRSCFNFVLKIPMVNGKLCYCQATARCKAGLLLDSDNEDRIIKNVMNHNSYNLKLYETALTCPEFDC